MCKKIWTLFKMEIARIWHDENSIASIIFLPLLLPFAIFMVTLAGEEYLQVAITEPLPHSLNVALGSIYGIGIALCIFYACNCFSAQIFSRPRHSGELYPLLGSSTGRTSMALTKLGTVCLHVVFMALILGVGFVLGFHYIYSAEADNLRLTLGEGLGACAVILSLGLLVATGTCLISALAGSKSAAGEVKSVLTVMLPFVPLAPILANMTSEPAFQIMPFFNTGSCLYDIWMKQVSYENILITCAVNLFCALILGYFVCRAFHKPNTMLSTIPEEA